MIDLLWLLAIPLALVVDWALDEDGARAWWDRTAEAARVRSLICPACRAECGWTGTLHHGECGRRLGGIRWSQE